MNLLKQHFWSGLILLAIIILSLTLRVYNLSGLPIFTDEAIYLRWAQIALQDANWRFISLTDGKQPLFIWLVMAMMRVFDDPLVAGRMVSVVSGVGTIIGLFFLTLQLFKRKSIALLASLLYVCFPFAQVVDRMALYDSLSGALTVWALYFSIKLVRNPQLVWGYTLGFFIGVGALNKSTNFFSMYLLPVTLLLFNFSKKDRLRRIGRWILFAGVAIVIAQVMYLVLRLSPFFHIIEQKNALFIYPISEWLQNPFASTFGNLRGLADWLLEYLTISYTALIIFAFLIRTRYREKLLLFLYFLIPFVGLAVFGRIVFPRFTFFMSLTLLPLAAYSLDYIARWVVTSLKLKRRFYAIYAIVVIVFISYPLYVSFVFAHDPLHSRIAHADYEQYVSSWTAGWGVTESIEFFREEAKEGEIFIGTEGTFGLLPFALEIELVNNPNVEIKGYWPVGEDLPEEVKTKSTERETFMIFYQPQHQNFLSDHLELVQKTQMGNSEYTYRVYRVVGY